jgi:hypothetical protein
MNSTAASARSKSHRRLIAEAETPPSCAIARGVTEEDLSSLRGLFIDGVEFAELVAESSVVSFYWRRGPQPIGGSESAKATRVFAQLAIREAARF